jgi:hypothetical protein
LLTKVTVRGIFVAAALLALPAVADASGGSVSPFVPSHPGGALASAPSSGAGAKSNGAHPDVAGAKVYVAPVGTTGAGKNCDTAPYSSVQTAIDEAPESATIEICPGTYSEQLTIEKAVKLYGSSASSPATIALPPAPEVSTSSCEAGEENFDEVVICTPATVTIKGLTIEAKQETGSCAGGLNGILVLGGGTLDATKDTVVGATNVPLNGCQRGLGILVGDSDSEPGTAVLKSVNVSGYQKNGITAVGHGTTLTVTGSTVTGAGPTPEIAQNGIQISFGAVGTVKKTVVSGNECDVASCGLEGEQATGVLFYGEKAGSSLQTSTVSSNDDGVYNHWESNSVPTAPEVTVSKDTLTDNRYEGVALDTGDALIDNDTINGTGEFGIQLYLYDGQKYAPDSSANHDTIEGQAVAVDVTPEGSQVKKGEFLISNSAISGNGTEVIDPSPTFLVVEKNDH